MVYFVGAGPGAADLITVRGAKLLKSASVVIYAGSLVNPELLAYVPLTCEIYNSAFMTLEEVLEVMERAEKKGKTTVRLHTGDPCLYGAIREQMDGLDQRGIAYEVCPGVSSFCGAAASLKLEYTLPEISQSLIITRLAGRTPVPDRESIASFAAHKASMAVFLSAGRLKELSAQLEAGGYKEDTPAAIVYKATWPEEKKVICTVGTLASRAREEEISKTALILVGETIRQTGYGRSKLYDPAFATGFRPDGSRGLHGEEVLWGKKEFRTDRLAVICFTVRGGQIGSRLVHEFRNRGSTCQGFIKTVSAAAASGPELTPVEEPLSQWTKQMFEYKYGGIIFIGAAGIAVRAVAPYLKDKLTDPAVVVVDESGSFSVSLLSGHMGGANALARCVAEILGAVPVVTTATDGRGLFAVDEFAARNGLSLSDRELAKMVSADLLEGRPVGFFSDLPLEGSLPEGFTQEEVCERNVWITWKQSADPGSMPALCMEKGKKILRLIPKVLCIGIGCRRGASSDTLLQAILQALEEYNCAAEAVAELASIDLKRKEPGLIQAAETLQAAFHVYTAEELRKAAGEYEESSFVERVAGVGNVCQRAAVKMVENQGGWLVAPKKIFHGVAIAVAQTAWKGQYADQTGSRG